MKCQATSLHFYCCFLFVGRRLDRLYAEVSPTRCCNGLAGAHQPLPTTPNSYLGQRRESTFSCWICSGKLGRLNVCLKPLGPNTPLSLFAVTNNPLRTVHSTGNMVRESSGLEETSWGHLAPSGNLNGIPASTLPERSCLLTTPVSHMHTLCISKPVFSFILQWNRLLNCIPFCCGGACLCLCRSLIKMNVDSFLLALYRHLIQQSDKGFYEK